jgi:ABC transporter substrate binding protein
LPERPGWTEGHNIEIDTRWATADVESLERSAKQLVALQPDLILTGGTPATAAMRQQTNTIPIIFAMVGDPVGSGFVGSLSRPGGNLPRIHRNRSRKVPLVPSLEARRGEKEASLLHGHWSRDRWLEPVATAVFCCATSFRAASVVCPSLVRAFALWSRPSAAAAFTACLGNSPSLASAGL